MTSISDTNVVNAPGGLVELGYITRTTDFSATTTNPNLVFTSNLTVVCDGSPVLVEFCVPRVDHATANPYNHLTGLIRIDGVDQSRLFERVNWNSGQTRSDEMYVSQRFTPAAGVRTFNVNCYVHTIGTSSALLANAWGSVNPIWMRVSKIIQASQLIVQTPNAPLVTSLPSNAIDGQEVRYLADNTNGIIWNFRYRAGSSSSYKWEFIGGQPLYSFIAAWEGTTTNYPNYTTLATVGPSLSVPLAGEYMVDLSYISQETNGGYSTTIVTQATGAPLNVSNALFQIDATTADVQTSFTSRALALTTTNPLRVLYARNGTGTANFGQRHLRFTPIRVSA